MKKQFAIYEGDEDTGLRFDTLKDSLQWIQSEDSPEEFSIIEFEKTVHGWNAVADYDYCGNKQ